MKPSRLTKFSWHGCIVTSNGLPVTVVCKPENFSGFCNPQD
jgi:hypothetical protein